MPGEDDWPLDEEDSFKGCDDLPMPVTDHLDAAKAVVTNPFCHADKLFHPIIGPDGRLFSLVSSSEYALRYI